METKREITKKVVDGMRLWTIDSPEFWRENVKSILRSLEYYDIPKECSCYLEGCKNILRGMLECKRFPAAQSKEFNWRFELLRSDLEKYFNKKEDEVNMNTEVETVETVVETEEANMKRVKSFNVTQNSEYEYAFKGTTTVTVDGKEVEISVVAEVYDGTVVYHKAEMITLDRLYGAVFKRLPKSINLPELSLVNGVSSIRDMESVFEYLFLMTDITTYGDNTLVSVDQALAFEDPDYVFEDETDEVYYDTLLDLDALECA